MNMPRSLAGSAKGHNLACLCAAYRETVEIPHCGVVPNQTFTTESFACSNLNLNVRQIASSIIKQSESWKTVEIPKVSPQKTPTISLAQVRIVSPSAPL